MGASAKSLAQLGLEASPGIIVAAKMLMPGTHKFNLLKKFDQPIEMRGSYDSYFENIQPLTRHAEWEMDAEYYPESNLNLWLMIVNGTPTIFAVPAGTGYSAFKSWILNPGDTLKTATWEEFDGTASWQYPFSFAQKIELDFTPEKIVTYKVTGFSQDRITMGAGIGNNVTSLPQPIDLPLPGATAKLTIDAVPLTAASTGAMSVPTTLAGTAGGTGGTIAAGTYFYKVTAFDDWGETQASNEPAGIAVTLGQKVTLTWVAPTTGTATGYRIWRSTATGTETLLATHSGAVATWIDDGATDYTVTTATPPTTNTTPINTVVAAPAGTAAGTGGTLPAATYFYKVTAFNQWGETPASPESTGVVVTVGQKVTLTWTAPTGGTALGYNIYRSTTTGTEVYVDSITVSPYVDAGGQGVTTTVPPTVNGTQQFSGVQSNLNVLSANLSIELQQREIYTLNSGGAFTRVYRGRRKGTATMELDFLNLSEYNDFINFKYKVFQFTFTGKPLAVNSSQVETLVVTLPLTYVTYEIDKTKENVTAKVMGDIMYDPNLGYSHQVRACVNATAVANY